MCACVCLCVCVCVGHKTRHHCACVADATELKVRTVPGQFSEVGSSDIFTFSIRECCTATSQFEQNMRRKGIWYADKKLQRCDQLICIFSGSAQKFSDQPPNFYCTIFTRLVLHSLFYCKVFCFIKF